MKKAAVLFILFIFSGIISAQDFDGVKIYLNPGHGGHDSNDRYIAGTGFWESDGNLTKGLYLRDLLIAHNANVMISRTQNRTEDDKPLSDIDAEANAFNADYFHSIHSNAHNETVNYPLVLFRGTDSNPVFSQAKTMGSIIWNQLNLLDDQWTYWKYSWENNRGDWSFYNNSNGLSVLRDLNMPGTLSEGNFHDYIPNSWRLMSIDYRKHEAVVLFRSFLQYFNLGKLDYGIIAGLVRDKNQQVPYNFNYNNGLPNDKKLALNGAEVQLLPSGDTYTTDDMNNGFYMFDSLPPGEYKVVFKSGEYATDTVRISAIANKTVFANAFMVEDTARPPRINYAFPKNGTDNISTYETIEITFSRAMNKDSTEKAFSIDPPAAGSFIWTNNDMTFSFVQNDAFLTDTEYTVLLSTDVRSAYNIPMQADSSFSFHTELYHVEPAIVNFVPAAEQDSVFTHTDIYFEFDAKMRRQNTEDAFSITPPVEGMFKWENDDRKLLFVPAHPLIADTLYTVRLSANAENSYGVSVKSDTSFTFKTRKYNKVQIVNSFPGSNAEDVSTKMKVIVLFERQVTSNTAVPEKFHLTTESGTEVSYEKFFIDEQDGRGRITFIPRNELERHSEYILTIFPGIYDTEGFMLQDTVVFPFETAGEKITSGSINDDFEEALYWTDPNQNETTTGTDSVLTTFLRTYSYSVNGTYSGRLKYVFSEDSGGVCRALRTELMPVGSDPNSEFGIWIYGDFGFNKLELWFNDSGENISVVSKDSINWYGWKFLHFPLSTVNLSGDLFFNSIVIKQNTNGSRNNVLYIDDIQNNVLVGMPDESNRNNLVRTYELRQNYPNPFNPSTVFKYFIPKGSRVNLSVFNILGQQIKTLVNAYQQPGEYSMEFNAAGLPSGLYFFRLEAGTFSETKKMILIR